jgi:hypothetical protein
VAIPFTNAREHQAELLRLAGQPVTVIGVWVDEALRIETIEAETP